MLDLTDNFQSGGMYLSTKRLRTSGLEHCYLFQFLPVQAVFQTAAFRTIEQLLGFPIKFIKNTKKGFLLIRILY
jgi:hypothetical protein